VGALAAVHHGSFRRLDPGQLCFALSQASVMLPAIQFRKVSGKATPIGETERRVYLVSH